MLPRMGSSCGLLVILCQTVYFTAQMATTKKSNPLTLLILAAMVGGVALGFVLNKNVENHNIASIDKVLEPFSLIADVFLRLIKMIVAPLVFTTLVVGKH